MYTDSFHYEIVESTIRHCKRGFKIQLGAFLFNVICLILYLYFLYSNNLSHAWVYSMGVGAFAISIIWSFLFLIETYLDLQGERSILNHYNKLREDYHFFEELSGLQKAKKEYEDLFRNLKVDEKKPANH